MDNAGSPTRGDPHGDGVPIVAKCSGQCLRQDEGEQVSRVLTDRKVREMRTAETIIGLLKERGKKRLPLERFYKLLFNRDLFLEAYGKIYRNKGAMTHGVTDETPDGMSLAKIDAIIEALRDERYHWLPARRVSIPKKSGKKRPLGLPMVRSYCPPYGKLSGLCCQGGSDQPIHPGSTVAYFACVDENLVVSNGAEPACGALR